MTNNTGNIAKCAQRIKSVTNKLEREEKRIDILSEDGLKTRLQLTTDISNMWTDFSIDQLKHLNKILLTGEVDHDMSIAMCKCAKDLEISIPENIEISETISQLRVRTNETEKK